MIIAYEVTLRPSRLGLGVAALVAAFGALLVGFGLQGLLRSRDVIDLLLMGAGLYALWQAAHTPLGIRSTGGMVSVLGLFPVSVPLAELARIEVVRGGRRRLWTYRFLRRDGSLAFTADATLFGRADLERCLGVEVKQA